uniref:Uncharacterized protein n=1 Tax=Anguilla anguilla TaxID=7936 RepID=A0A0E9UYU1_ANGAN
MSAEFILIHTAVACDKMECSGLK